MQATPINTAGLSSGNAEAAAETVLVEMNVFITHKNEISLEWSLGDFVEYEEREQLWLNYDRRMSCEEVSETG